MVVLDLEQREHKLVGVFLRLHVNSKKRDTPLERRSVRCQTPVGREEALPLYRVAQPLKKFPNLDLLWVRASKPQRRWKHDAFGILSACLSAGFLKQELFSPFMTTCLSPTARIARLARNLRRVMACCTSCPLCPSGGKVGKH